MNDIEYLRKLDKRIWKKTDTPNNKRGKYTITENGTLTKAEWNKVKKIISDNKLVVVMISACHGFGCGVSIHKCTECPGAPAEHIITITQVHFNEKFNQGWDRFHPLSRSEENLKLVNFCGLPNLRERIYYEY